jgi:hypothetical protein
VETIMRLTPATAFTTLALAIASLAPGAAHAQSLIQASPGSDAGTLALTSVLANARGAPRLKIETRLRLLAAKQKVEDVTCATRRYASSWTGLGGTVFAPYECPVGGKILFITARQTYYDAAGRRLAPSDPDLMAKAAKVTQTNFKWRWM